MKILFISKYGDALGIAHRLVQEGHQVSMFIQDAQYENSGKGLVDRVTSWRPNVAPSDLVVCDMVGFGQYEEVLRKMGRPFISCSKLGDIAELDRKKGMELFEKFDINTPITYDFDTPEEAKGMSNIYPDGGLVIKPSGNVSTDKTFVTKTPDSYVWGLDQLNKKQELIVQEFVEGIEISTEGWFNGRDFIKPFNHTFEEKKFMPGNIGQNTGCMGNIVIKGKETSKLVQETVAKLKPFLSNISYRGPVDINSIVTEDEVYALEATMRLGYDAIEALVEGLEEPLGDFLFEVATGIKKEFKMSDNMLLAVRISTPPWPMDEPSASQTGVPIEGINEDSLRHIFLTDVMLEDDEYKTAGGDGVIMKITAQERNVSRAWDRVKRTINNLTIQDMQYRNDIGFRVGDELKQLIEWGWIDG